MVFQKCANLLYKFGLYIFNIFNLFQMESEHSTTSLLVEDLEPKEGWFRSIFPYFRWIPTSPKLLKQAEENILQYVKTKSEGFYVDCSVPTSEEFSWCPPLKNCRIWTRRFGTSVRTETPLVMIHGMGAGLAFFCLNFDFLSKNRTVYTIDLPGFARSSRCSFKSNHIQAETQYIGALERWRQEVGLQKMVLLGHSFGGYLSSAYALKFPENVEHLILADPWGFPEKPADLAQRYNLPFYVRALMQIFRHFNPLAILRLAGPKGPSLVGRVRPDIMGIFCSLFSDDLTDEDRMNKCLEIIPPYIYHSNAHYPSGESAFHSMMTGFAWAKRPMFPRLADLNTEVPLTVIYGGKSWVTAITQDEFENVRQNKAVYTEVNIIPETGHHVYASAKDFNRIVDKACKIGKEEAKSKANSSKQTETSSTS